MQSLNHSGVRFLLQRTGGIRLGIYVHPKRNQLPFPRTGSFCVVNRVNGLVLVHPGPGYGLAGPFLCLLAYHRLPSVTGLLLARSAR
jgi:hypothetical protein